MGDEVTGGDLSLGGGRVIASPNYFPDTIKRKLDNGKAI